MDNDKVYFKKNNVACDFICDKTSAQFKRYKAFIELRDTTRDLLTAQELDKPDSVIKDLQAKLNTVYDDFYKKYGLIHGQSNKRYFGDDVSYNLVAGLASNSFLPAEYKPCGTLEQVGGHRSGVFRPHKFVLCQQQVLGQIGIGYAEIRLSQDERLRYF